jgi:hypothetical protein
MNLCSFKGGKQTMSDLKITFLKTLFDWIYTSSCLSCENVF